MLGMTQSLETRYMDATTIVEQADSYYLELSRSVDLETLQLWHDKIKGAEAMRLADVKIMDIYGARMPDRLMVDPTAASALAGRSASAETSASASAPGTNLTPIEQWIEYALLVEEMQ